MHHPLYSKAKRFFPEGQPVVFSTRRHHDNSTQPQSLHIGEPSTLIPAESLIRAVKLTDSWIIGLGQRDSANGRTSQARARTVNVWHIRYIEELSVNFKVRMLMKNLNASEASRS